ncbi:MAG: response regulator, partial [candidate division Zixibacteria bacterium]|nr:response regulator [candidate division Zixibacteria bacterium]
DGSSQNAILFIRESGAFKLGEGDLKTVDLYAGLAGLALRQNDMRRLDITRRRGLEKVLQLLRFDNSALEESDPGSFVAHLANILPSKSRAIAFARNENGSYRATAGHRVEPGDLDDFEIMPGEGIIGEVAVGHETKFVSGRSNVNEAVQSFDPSNRDAFQRIFGESGLPGLLAACPVGTADGIEGVVLFFLFDVDESEKGEWQRLLTLAAGLYSVRLTIAQLHQTTPVVPAAVDTEFWGEAINRLNNHLSAIIGNAELASIASDLSGETVNHFKSIIAEAEQAARFGRKLMDQAASKNFPDTGNTNPPRDLNSVIGSVLDKSHISDALHMVGGRPREIVIDTTESIGVDLEEGVVRSLFEEAIDRFASVAEDEDLLTVSTYQADGYVYLDISRHRKNFPPVEKVAGFGEYQAAGEALKHRPADTYLEHAASGDCDYAFDRYTPSPSYLSFRFPVKKTAAEPTQAAVSPPRVLAIDDQTVILDLISAMCQASGYQVTTAASGEEGLQLALSQEFDIILTDLSMPGMSGLEVAREVIKSRPDVPIVLITGWEVDIDRSRLTASGITQVLYKPFRIEQLTEMIRNLTAARSRP